MRSSSSVQRPSSSSSSCCSSPAKRESQSEEVRGELSRVECDSGFESKTAESPPWESRPEAEGAESEKESSMLRIGISDVGEDGSRIGCVFESIGTGRAGRGVSMRSISVETCKPDTNVVRDRKWTDSFLIQ